MLAVVTVTLVMAWPSFGSKAQGNRRQRMLASPQWKDGQFHNPQPLFNDPWGALIGMGHVSDNVSPHEAVPVLSVDAAIFSTPPASGLRVTWMGHSTVLVEIDGHRVLTDPMWGPRASPLTWVGPKRWYDPRLAIERLPSLDAVLVSHDHYDHLDRFTIEALNKLQTKFIVPLGVGAHLESWGVPANKIVELDWWQSTTLGDLTVNCTPARHASGRTVVTDKDATLWAGYALVTSKHRVYFSGDTGLFSAMQEIGRRWGPFDLTMIEVGQYHRSWPDWHIGPEQAVVAHALLRGRVMLPIHWGLFALAFHGWTEPVERVMVAAAKAHVPLMLPKPGESQEPQSHRAPARWWPPLPWETAEQHPVVSSQVNLK
ncbi:MAG: MBL fold metallo-hydrolase [Deltaproteobacteria bacterium]|nr:MBL fold metallo-hydrolase [Deltaproteobacteria bacterium]